MVKLASEENRREKLKSILKYTKNWLQAETTHQKTVAKNRIRYRTRPVIEPWTKKRKWLCFIFGTIGILGSGQLFSRGYLTLAGTVFAFGTLLDVTGLWLTEKRIRYFEIDTLDEGPGINQGNLEKRVSKIEDRLDGRGSMP